MPVMTTNAMGSATSGDPRGPAARPAPALLRLARLSADRTQRVVDGGEQVAGGRTAGQGPPPEAHGEPSGPAELLGLAHHPGVHAPGQQTREPGHLALDERLELRGQDEAAAVDDHGHGVAQRLLGASRRWWEGRML